MPGAGGREQGGREGDLLSVTAALSICFVILRLLSAACVTWGKITDFLFLMRKTRLFTLPFRPVLPACSVGRLWQSATLVECKRTAPRTASSIQDPQVLLEHWLRGVFTPQPSRQPLPMEGPLLFHLQVLLAAILQGRGRKMEGESINGTNAPKAAPKPFPPSGRIAAPSSAGARSWLCLQPRALPRNS